jgi:hypothetical protein
LENVGDKRGGRADVAEAGCDKRRPQTKASRYFTGKRSEKLPEVDQGTRLRFLIFSKRLAVEQAPLNLIATCTQPFQSGSCFGRHAAPPERARAFGIVHCPGFRRNFFHRRALFLIDDDLSKKPAN